MFAIIETFFSLFGKKKKKERKEGKAECSSSYRVVEYDKEKYSHTTNERKPTRQSKGYLFVVVVSGPVKRAHSASVRPAPHVAKTDTDQKVYLFHAKKNAVCIRTTFLFLEKVQEEDLLVLFSSANKLLLAVCGNNTTTRPRRRRKKEKEKSVTCRFGPDWN